MRNKCDICKQPVKKVGKLFKRRSLMLCKKCRAKFGKRKI